MLNLLPNEILIYILNYLIPFDVILKFNDAINIKRENNPKNINLIRASNQIFCNLALCNKSLKKIVYEKCFKSIYFNGNISIELLLIFKPNVIYAPYDEKLTEHNLRTIYQNNIQLKELYVERNSLIRDFKKNCPTLENYKNAWIPVFYDKYCSNHNYNNEITKKIKTPLDLMNNNYVCFKDEDAWTIFSKLFKQHDNIVYDLPHDKLKYCIDQNFYSMDLFLLNYDDYNKKCDESYLIININSYNLFKAVNEKSHCKYLNFLKTCCAHDKHYKTAICSFEKLDLGFVYYYDFEFHIY